jgi:hypothetical protein
LTELNYALWTCATKQNLIPSLHQSYLVFTSHLSFGETLSIGDTNSLSFWQKFLFFTKKSPNFPQMFFLRGGRASSRLLF